MYKLIYYLLFSSIFFASISFSQGGNTTGAAAGAPITLPFSGNGTTVGASNSVSNIEVYDIGFTSGNDWFYYFCATENTQVTFSLAFTPDPVDGVWPSISIYQGLPTNASLLQYNISAGDDPSLPTLDGTFIISSGSCYYVMIDNWAPPAGYPFQLDLTLPPAFPAPVLQPTCTNMGFETNDFSGWQGSWSNNVVQSNAGALTPYYLPATFNTTTAQHAITNAGTDAITGIPLVSPGFGVHSARVGDLTNGSGGATLQQQFSVTAANALFTYSYAVMIENALGLIPLKSESHPFMDSINAAGTDYVYLQNAAGTADSLGPHTTEQQPFFQIDLYDCTGVPIPCGQFLVTGGPNVPGFTKVPGTEYYYKDWTNVFIDLTAYVGTCVSIKYTTGDCVLGGHMCYAYVDAQCSEMTVPATTYFCPTVGGTVTCPLTGIAYSWTEVGNPAVIGTDQTLTVNPPAATTYQCIITNASGCNTTLLFPVDFYAEPTVTVTPTTICNGELGTLTAAGVVAGGTYAWAPGGGVGTSMSDSPVATTTYTCTYTDLNGCEATDADDITVNPLPAAPSTAPIAYCLNDVAVELTATPAASCTLNWYGTNATGGVASGVAPTPTTSAAGSVTYYVSQTNTVTNCEGPRASLVVTVNALPTITVNSPQVCPGVQATLTAGGADTYDWENGASLTDTYLVSPAVTTSYTVEGTDVNNCVNTAVATVTVAGVLSITVNSETICEGESIDLTASGATDYSWDQGASIGISTNNPFNVAPTTTTTYTVTGTTGGCSGTTDAVVTVNPVPASTAGANGPLCEGATLDLTGTDTGIPGTTYSWAGPNGFTSGSQNPSIPAVTAAANGTYTLTVSANGCSSSGTIAVVVNAIPSTTAGSNTPICDGSALNLTATNVAGANFSWTGPNAYTSLLQNPTIPSASVAATGSYTVTVTANGCSSTSSTSVVVNTIPTTTASSNAPICEGTTLNLLASNSLGSTFSWTGPNGFTSLAQNPSIPSVTTAGTGTYIVTVTANNCSSTSNTAVTINPGPTTVAGSNSPICDQSTLSLTASTSLVAGTSYSWTGPNSFSSLSQNPSIALAGTVASGVYTVTVTAAGCSSNSTVNVTVSPIPLVAASSNAPICAGQNLTLTATPSAPLIAGSTYSWSGPAAFASGLQNPTIAGATTAASGTYTITISANGCSSQATTAVVVNAVPLTVAASNTNLCEGTALNLTASNTGVVGTTYNWAGPNGFTSALQNPTIASPTTAASGTYIVTVAANSCSSTASTTTVINAPIVPQLAPIANPICEGSAVPTLPTISIDNPAITGTWLPATVDVTSSASYVFTPNAGQCALPVNLDIVVIPLPTLVTFDQGPLCEPATVDLTQTSVTAGSSGGTLSFWADGLATIPLADPSEVTSGSYYITSSTSTVPVCTTIPQEVVVTIMSSPTAAFTPVPNVVSTLHPYSEMNNQSEDAVDYIWNFGDGEMDTVNTDPAHLFPSSDSGKYIITLIAISEFGCLDTAFATITVNEELIYYVPNTFTPDEDPHNEEFLPIFTSGYDIFQYSLLIFDRWGELIFESHNAEKGWRGTYGPDATLCQDGTYTWKIEFKVKNGRDTKIIYGHVNLLK